MDMTLENIINVTLIEPKLKHPTIFKRFDELQGGESIIIHNDHDPKPVYYQLLGERGNVFTWEYLEEGPEWWKVKIRKRIAGENEETIGELAAKDLRKVEIFKKYGLDFCCGGKKTVKEACAEKGLDVTKIEQELQQAAKAPASHPIPYDEWDLNFLSDYIVNTHHRYIRKNLPDITAYAEKVMRVHSDRHPELIGINNLVKELTSTLTTHIDEEEMILFPKIKTLVNTTKDAVTQKVSGSESLKSLVDSTETEHEVVGKELEEIRKLSNNFTLPDDACASYSLLFRMLDELENDTHLHIHLENNILFSKAVKLEEQLS